MGSIKEGEIIISALKSTGNIERVRPPTEPVLEERLESKELFECDCDTYLCLC